MKQFFYVILVVMISCTNKKKVDYTNNSYVNDSIKYDYRIENSSLKEFNSSKHSHDLFSKPNSEILIDPFKRQPDVFIQLQKNKIAFKNINPVLDTLFSDDQKVNYFNLGFDQKIGKHLVQVSYYEGDDFLLIDHKTARIDTINGTPNYSPEKKRLISFYINPYNERKINGEYIDTGDVEVYQTLDDELKAIVKESFDFIPIEIRWKDENTIIIKAVSSLDYAKNARTPGVTVDDLKNFIYKKIIIKEVKNKG